MYRIKGLYEAVSKHCTSILSGIDQAKLKLVTGRTSDNFDFREEVYQSKAYVNCDAEFGYAKLGEFNQPKSINFSYWVPILALSRLSKPDVKTSVPFSFGFSCIIDLFQYNIDLSYIDFSSMYEVISLQIDKFVNESVAYGKLIYSFDGMQIYYVERFRDQDSPIRCGIGLIVGVSEDEVLFILALDMSIGLPFDTVIEDNYLKFRSIKAFNEDNLIFISFLFNDGTGVKCCLGEDFGVSYVEKFKFESKIDKERISFT